MVKVSKKAKRAIRERRLIPDEDRVEKPHSKTEAFRLPLWGAVKTKGKRAEKINQPAFVYKGAKVSSPELHGLEKLGHKRTNRNLKPSREMTPEEKIARGRSKLYHGRQRPLTRQGALNNISLENQSTKCGHNFSRYKVSDRNRMNPLGW